MKICQQDESQQRGGIGEELFELAAGVFVQVFKKLHGGNGSHPSWMRGS
jgi:hypothetical protein